MVDKKDISKMIEGMSAFDLLKEEMKTEEIHLKVNAVHRMSTVIAAIGLEASLEQLVPYIDQLIDFEDDEVLFAIAEELGKVWKMIPDNIVFLPLLEKLAKSDETVVRE